MNWKMLAPIFLYIGIIGLSFYALLYLPQKKQRKKIELMQQSVKDGDHVVTIGGIVGTVLQIDRDVLVLEVSEHQDQLRVVRSAIQKIV